MAFGLTTSKMHLDALDPAALGPEEIKWNAFIAWNNAHSPTFAGRYFLTQPDAQQVLDGPLLWAHGEGVRASNQAKSLKRISPLQHADQSRLAATGRDGEAFGRIDASAFCDYIAKCVNIGELSVPGKFIYVFLEVADDTELSVDYWASWSATVSAQMISKVVEKQIMGVTVLFPEFSQPFLPCICCKFSKTTTNGKYAPVTKITDCLGKADAAVRGKQTRCFGFWARATDAVGTRAPEPVLDFSIFDIYNQPQGGDSQTVWVLLWRYAEQGDPVDPAFAGGNFVTLDATNEATAESRVTKFMLQIEAWSTTGDPTSFGVDKGADISTEIACLKRTNMGIRHLPAGVPPNIADGIPVNLSGKTSFVGRYYSATRPDFIPNPKDLRVSEALKIGRAGVKIVATWQKTIFNAKDEEDIRRSLTTPGVGIDEGHNAFGYAATKIDQPPYTPIYFAVDFDDEGSLDAIVEYFKDVATGYRDYLLEQQANAVPYYVGVYASRTVLDALYRKGLASYFWQAWPPSWGGPGIANGEVWPHDNLWQVCLWLDATGVSACATASGLGGCRDPAAPGMDFVDLNVSWGDEGGW